MDAVTLIFCLLLFLFKVRTLSFYALQLSQTIKQQWFNTDQTDVPDEAEGQSDLMKLWKMQSGRGKNFKYQRVTKR